MLTREQAIEEHRKMWNWIADETEKRKRIVNKSEYFDENNIPYYFHLCFCCEYTDQFDGDCKKCPIDWGVKYV